MTTNSILILFFVLCTSAGVWSQSEQKIENQIESSQKALGKGDYAKALKVALNAKATIEDENSLNAFKIEKQIGKIYLQSENKDKALTTFFELLKKCSGSGHDELEVDVLISIGYLYYGMELYEKALKYYQKGLKLSKKIKYESGIAMSINNVAAVLETKEKYAQAKKYFLQAIEINKAQGNEQWLGINYMNVGIIERKLHHYDSEIHWLKKADTIFTKVNDRNFKAKTLIFLAKHYQKKGNNELAFHHVRNADSIAKEHDFYGIRQSSSELLKELNLEQGDTSQAFFYQQNFIEAKEKKDKRDKVEYSLGLEQKFVLEKFEMKRKAESDNYKRNQKLILFLIVLGVLCILMFLGRLRAKLKQAKREKVSIAEDLEKQSKQLASKTIELAKRQQVIADHVNTIEKTIEINDSDDKNFALSRLKKSLEKEASEDVMTEFEMCFESIHTEFYENLNLQFPNLSRNERRLSAFLYLNMSSKEISEITGQRIPTIEVARTRLRKKLNLNQTGISLSGFLTKMGSS